MNRHHWIAIGFILFGLFGIWQASQIYSVYTVATEDLGPKVFPMLACGGIILASIGKLITAPHGKQEPFLDKEGWMRVAGMTGLFLAYYFGLMVLGFIISTPIFLYVQIRYMSERKVKVVTAVIVSVVITAILYVLFNNLLQCLLPTGMFF